MDFKLRCLIVDDEPIARQGLKEYVDDIDFLELVGMAQDIEQAQELMHDTKVDLMFLDIQMPKLSGIDFLRTNNKLPKIILTTAYSEYAIEGYALNVVDYLLKPISFSRFYKSCRKVKELCQNIQVAKEKDDDYFFIKNNKKYEAIYIKDILFIEALQNYIIIHTDTKKSVAYLSLKDISAKLRNSSFLQVHKSYIVSINKIDDVSREEISIGGHRIPVGKNYSGQLFKEIVMAKLLKK